MAINRTALGMNARNFLYINRYNSPDAKRIADDKLLTKQILLNNNIATPDLIAKFINRDSIRHFRWDKLPKTGFVIKPARGYGGGGIIAFSVWHGNHGSTVSGEYLTVKEMESHILDIHEGAYSLQFLPDKAFAEELIIPHPFFCRLTPIGLPDIRVIVFNQVPVMAMLRIPTDKSKGKANLHLGAIGIGIDIRTGITTYAISQDQPITRLPSSKIKTQGIKIHQWNDILLLATKAQSVSDLGYAGVDIVIDVKQGPLVLEINARPGLSIQNCNRASLRERLERVEHIPISTPKRGVEVAESLFAEAFSEKVITKPKVLDVIEPVTLGFKGRVKTVEAKLDTGAFRTSIDQNLTKELEIPSEEETLLVKAASGRQKRKTAKITFVLAGKKIRTLASVTDRSHMQFPMIIGRRDLKGFLINPILYNEPGDSLEGKKKNNNKTS